MSLHLLDPMPSHSLDRIIAAIGNATAWIGLLTDPSFWTALGGVGVSGATILYFVTKSLHERQRMIQEQQLHELKMQHEKEKTLEEEMYG